MLDGLAAKLDHLLVRRLHRGMRKRLLTPFGAINIFDTGGAGACVVMTPDGPNLIEHYEAIIARLSPEFRVVLFDMPGFGHSTPAASYQHRLDQGAALIHAVLERLELQQVT